MSGKMESHLQKYTTENIQRLDQFAYWYDAICEKVMSVELDRRKKGPFYGMLQSCDLGLFCINRVVSEEHIADLTKAGISRLKSHYYKLHMQKTSIAKVRQYGSEIVLHPGDAILIDSISPFHLDFPTSFEAYSIRIPREALRPMLRDPIAAATTPIPGRSPLCKALKHYIHFLMDVTVKPLTEDQIELYLDNLMGLIAVATSASAEGQEAAYNSGREKKISQIKRYILSNLENPELSPTNVANHFSISVSYLHKLFAKEDQTFGSFLREHRLDYAATYLQNHTSGRHTISELAYHLGFNDLSYFWRLFRDRYGMTPRKFRNTVSS